MSDPLTGLRNIDSGPDIPAWRQDQHAAIRALRECRATLKATADRMWHDEYMGRPIAVRLADALSECDTWLAELVAKVEGVE